MVKMETVTMAGLSHMSKEEILKRVITEKLTAAAQQIFAVVERTLSAYEEEAAGLRQEIDRQRDQLGILLQLKQEVLELSSPVSEPAAEDRRGGGGREATKEEEEQKHEPREEHNKYLRLFSSTEDQMEEDESNQGGEEEEDLPEPEEEETQRVQTPMLQTDGTTASRCGIYGSEDHINLRIRILEDPESDLTDPAVFRAYPLQELKCPPGLLEADFFNLLRSFFPQLAAWTHFDFLVENERELKALKVQPLTPEEIHDATGPTTIYIYPTNMLPEDIGEEPPFNRRELMKSYRFSPMWPRLRETLPKEGRLPKGKPPNTFCFRVLILNHNHPDVTSVGSKRKVPVKELQCPGGMSEADFLKLLRSSFPELAGQTPFDIFSCNAKRQMMPVRLGVLTPEEVYECVSLRVLFIKPKSKAAADDSPSSHQPTRSLSIFSTAYQFQKSMVKHKQNFTYLKICIVDPNIKTMATSMFQKYPIYLTKCPRGLKAAEFLDRLRATFSQLEARARFDFLACKQNTLVPLGAKAKTPEEIESLISPAVLYIRWKKQRVRSRKTKNPPPTPGQSFPNSSFGSQQDFTDLGELDYEDGLESVGVLENQEEDEAPVKTKKTDKTQKEQLGSEDTLRHVDEAAFKCQTCGESTCSLHDVSTQFLKHSGQGTEQGFRCNICRETFHSHLLLRVHARTHRVKPFVCCICGRGYGGKHSLWYHIKRKHPGVSPQL